MKCNKNLGSHFGVFLLGRSGLVYEQNGMLTCIDGEGLAGEPYRYVIVADSITRWDYPASTPIDKQERATIIEQLRREFDREGCELVVEERGYGPEIANAYHDRIAGPMLLEFKRLCSAKSESIRFGGLEDGRK